MAKKLMVCGSRTINDREFVFKWIDTLRGSLKTEGEDIIIIEGEASGVDKIAKDYALINHLPYLSYPADWKTFGKKAGPIRNEQMVKDCDVCLIIWDGKSRGTKNDIDLCERYNKLHTTVIYD